jgi:hypothetical protein
MDSMASEGSYKGMSWRGQPQFKTGEEKRKDQHLCTPHPPLPLCVGIESWTFIDFISLIKYKRELGKYYAN